MKLELTITLNPQQMHLVMTCLEALVDKEVQRQLKFKRNEVLREVDESEPR